MMPDEVMQQAAALGRSIADLEEFVEYQAAGDALTASNEAERLYSSLDPDARAGVLEVDQVGVDATARSGEWSDEAWGLVLRYLQAQRRFERIVTRVMDVLSFFISGEVSRDGAGCGQGCARSGGGCASCCQHGQHDLGGERVDDC